MEKPLSSLLATRNAEPPERRMIKQFDLNPTRRGRFAARLLKIVFLSLLSCSIVAAESPPSDRPLQNPESAGQISDLLPLGSPSPAKSVGEAADSKTPKAALNSEADLIQRALQGQEVSNPDSMLGDVLDLIRKRGSLLEGSELSKEMPPILERPGSDDDSFAATSQTIRRLKTAEQLIRSARQLLEIEPQDPETKALVDRMRFYAVKLLRSSGADD
jgi:hypothetical protein